MNVRGTMGTLYLQSSEVVFCDALSSYKFGATAYKTDYIEPFVYKIGEPAIAGFIAFYHDTNTDFSLEYVSMLIHCKDTNNTDGRTYIEEIGHVTLSALRTLIICSDECLGKAGWCSRQIEPGAKYLAADIINCPDAAPDACIEYIKEKYTNELDLVTGSDLIDYCNNNGITGQFALNNNIRSTQFTEEALEIAETDWNAGSMFRAAVAKSNVTRVPIYRVNDNALIFALNGADRDHVKADFSGKNAFLDLL